MKNKLFKLLFVLLALTPIILSAQIPNPDFESWDSMTLNKPTGYRVYGMTTKVSGYKSPFAVFIQKNSNINDGPGAVLYGDPENGFSGGIPVSGRPDSAVAFLKYHLVPGDTAWFLVYFKRNGNFISHDIFKFYGSDSNTFNRLSYKINYSDTGIADSLVVGIASTNPNDTREGSFVIADSIHFVGGNGSVHVPNGGFEQWYSVGFNSLKGWLTSNGQAVQGKPFPVSKTADHSNSSYACKIQNISIGNGKYVMGYIMAGRQGNNGPKPGFPVQGRDSVLYFNYKCFPQGGDTVNIAIMMFKNDTLVGMGTFSQHFNINTWSLTAVPINYFNGSVVPDSAVIFCSAFQGGSQAKGATILYVDGFNLNSPRASIKPSWILPQRAYPNPVNDVLTIEMTQKHKDIKSVTIRDIIGKTVTLPVNISSDNKTIKIVTVELGSGIWFYEIQASDIKFSGSFVISR